MLPNPEVIYDKEFRFLDETLSKKEERREANFAENMVSAETTGAEATRIPEESGEPEEQPENN